jgi:hypothetical protein
VKRLNPTWEKQQTIDRKANSGRYDLIDFIFFVGIAIIIDFCLVWFDLTILGVIAFSLIFLLKKVDTGFAKWICGSISVSFIPMTTVFVITVYLMNTKFAKKQIEKAGPAGQVAMKVAEASSGNMDGAKGAMQGVKTETPETKSSINSAEAGSRSESSLGQNTSSGGNNDEDNNQNTKRNRDESSSSADNSTESNSLNNSADSATSDSTKQSKIGREYEGATGKDIGQKDSADAMDGPTDENRAEADSGKGGRFPSEDPVITKRETDSANDQPINENKKSPVASTEKLDKEKNPKKSEPDNTDHLI